MTTLSSEVLSAYFQKKLLFTFAGYKGNKRKMDNNKTTETFTSVGIEDLVEAEKR